MVSPLVSVPGLSGAAANSVLLIVSFLMLLVGAEIFTNGVEWLGQRLGVSESATGSILAAVGTALPETMIPVIAIIQGLLSGDMTAANEVGVGAILGAPFMLATIAMFMIGISVFLFAGRRSFGAEFHFNETSTRRDLSFFLVGYTLAFLVALVHNRTIEIAVAIGLILLYLVYVYRSLTTGELIQHEELEELHLGQIVDKARFSVDDTNPSRKRRYAHEPNTLITIFQTLIALSIIVGGAHLFVEEVTYFSTEVLNIPPAVLALLLAPLATELPEKFNSVIWISRDKDTLAIGNIAGAMAFQGTLPVTLGILFTSWNLSLEWGTAGFLNGFSAILAIIGGAIIYLRARRSGEGNMHPLPFLIGGVLYALFIVVLIWHVMNYDLAVAAH